MGFDGIDQLININRSLKARLDQTVAKLVSVKKLALTVTLYHNYLSFVNRLKGYESSLARKALSFSANVTSVRYHSCINNLCIGMTATWTLHVLPPLPYKLPMRLCNASFTLTIIAQ